MALKEKTRIYFYDNLKFILIMLVVIGHFIQYNLDYKFFKGLFLFIYSFHMPLFIFVTGFFSKKIIEAETNQRLNKILSYLILFVLYKIALFILLKYGFHEVDSFYLFTEMEPPWYLLACAIWMLVASQIKNVKPKYMLGISFLFSIFVGYDNNISDQFCLSRVIVFFPFFLLGYYCSKDRMEKIVNWLHVKRNMVLAFFFIILCLSLFILFADDLYFLRPLFTGRNPFVYMEFPIDLIMTGSFFRTLCLLFSVIISIAFMALIPRRKLCISKFGERTLQIYVLHYFIVIILAYSTLGQYMANFFGAFYPIVLIILAIVTTFLLSTKFFEKPFSKVLKLRFNKIYNNQEGKL